MVFFMILQQFLEELKKMKLSPQVHGWASVRLSMKDLEYDFWNWAITKWCSALKKVHGWATRDVLST